MKPYPLELRERIVAAVDQQSGTIEESAELFGVTERYLYKFLKLRQETGDLTPQPHGGGAKAKLDEKRLLKMAELIAEFPDATLEDLRELLRRRCRVSVCTNTLWRRLQQRDCTLKKRPVAPEKPARKSARSLGRSN